MPSARGAAAGGTPAGPARSASGWTLAGRAPALRLRLRRGGPLPRRASWPSRLRAFVIGRWGAGGLHMLLPPQELLIRPRERLGAPVADLDDPCRQPLDEVAVVADEDQRAAVVHQRVEQHVLRVQIEVVGRLVEQQQVGRPQEHAGDGQPRALAAGQHTGLLVDVVARKQEAAQDVPDCRHHVHRRAARERLVDGQHRVEARRLVLREVLGHDLVAQMPFSAVGRLFSREHAHQRRLAGAVGADKRNPIAALDVQRQVVEDGERPVRLPDVRRAPSPSARSLARPET